jgi:RNA polymerase subunit RPABC4/transcription elongation factor Spt4
MTNTGTCQCPYCDGPAERERAICQPCQVVIRNCPSCGTVLPQDAPVCPGCSRKTDQDKG